MAETAEQFRESERRKMRLQAMLAAKRASLMTMGNAGIIPRPDDLPGRTKADANNAAALKYLENSGGPVGPQSLNTLEASGLRMDPFNNTGVFPQVANSPYTKALNTRAANVTADDQYRAGLGDSPKRSAIADMLLDKSPSRLPYDPSLLAAVDGGVGQGTGVDPRTRPAPPWHTGLRYPGVSPEPIQNSAPPQVSAVAPNQSGGQSSYGPGLTPAAAEERYGPGGMYGTQPLPGGLYDQQGISPATMGSPSQMNSSASALSSISAKPTKTNSEHLTDRIKLIAKRKAIIAGSAAVFGNASDGRKAAERYEAKALANLGIYAGKYALSNLDDSDFQSKQKLFQALVEGGVMPLDQILKVVDSGVANEAKEKKFVNWTNGINTIPLREGQEGPPGYHVGKLEKESKGSSMQFIDLEGVGHLGYVQHDENGIPRNFLMDGSSVPVGWDMVSPTANKIENTVNLDKQGQKMTEARQVAMAQMSRKWSNDAATYFFNEAGDFKANRLALILTSLNVPGEGRLAWTQMKNALASALRLESGAAISVEEAAKFKSRFFPDATDTQKTIVWKLRAFSDYVRALEEVNNPQWVYDNLPHTIWNPKKVKTEKERDALPPGSYFTTPNGSLHKLPRSSDIEVPLP